MPTIAQSPTISHSNDGDGAVGVLWQGAWSNITWHVFMTQSSLALSGTPVKLRTHPDAAIAVFAMAAGPATFTGSGQDSIGRQSPSFCDGRGACNVLGLVDTVLESGLEGGLVLVLNAGGGRTG